MAIRYITGWTAKRNGKKDGKRNIPPNDYDGSRGKLSSFEEKVLAVVEREIAGFHQQWETYKESVTAQLNDMIPDLKKSHQEYADARQLHKKDEIILKKNWTPVIWFILLLIIEVPMNFYAFQFLRDPGLVSWALALILSAVVPVAGHIAGKTIKNREKRLFDVLFTIFLLSVCVVLMLLVAYARQDYILAGSKNPRVAQFAFYIFLFGNILVYLLAIGIGYQHGYEHPSLVRKQMQWKRKKGQFVNRESRLKDNFNRTLNAIREKILIANELAAVYRGVNKQQRWKMAHKMKQPVHDVQFPDYFNDGTELPIMVNDPFKKYAGRNASNEPNPAERWWESMEQENPKWKEAEEYLRYELNS